LPIRLEWVKKSTASGSEHHRTNLTVILLRGRKKITGLFLLFSVQPLMRLGDLDGHVIY
jgi:hypothetical protein